MYILFSYAHFELTVGYKYFTVASDKIDKIPDSRDSSAGRENIVNNDASAQVWA